MSLATVVKRKTEVPCRLVDRVEKGVSSISIKFAVRRTRTTPRNNPGELGGVFQQVETQSHYSTTLRVSEGGVFRGPEESVHSGEGGILLNMILRDPRYRTKSGLFHDRKGVRCPRIDGDCKVLFMY